MIGSDLSVIELDGDLQPGPVGPLAEGVTFEAADETHGTSSLPGDVRFFGAAADRKQRQYRDLSLRPLHRIGILRIPQGMLIGRGLVATSAGVLLAGHSISGPARSLGSQGWSAPIARRAGGDAYALFPKIATRRIDGQAVVGICPGYRIWGHILVDWLPRLLLAASRAAPEATIVVPRDLPSVALELLESLGLGPERIFAFDEKAEVIIADQLVVAGQVRRASKWWSPAATYLTRLKSLAIEGGDHPRRIFVARGHLRNQRRRMLDRPSVEAALRRYGFEQVRPETMSIGAQLALFAHAEAIVGEAGSGLHGSLFGSERTRVGVLQSEHLDSFLQASLCGAMGQSVAFTFGEGVALDDTSDFGDFLVDDASLETMLATLLEGPD